LCLSVAASLSVVPMGHGDRPFERWFCLMLLLHLAVIASLWSRG